VWIDIIIHCHHHDANWASYGCLGMVLHICGPHVHDILLCKSCFNTCTSKKTHANMIWWHTHVPNCCRITTHQLHEMKDASMLSIRLACCMVKSCFALLPAWELPCYPHHACMHCGHIPTTTNKTNYILELTRQFSSNKNMFWALIRCNEVIHTVLSKMKGHFFKHILEGGWQITHTHILVGIYTPSQCQQDILCLHNYLGATKWCVAQSTSEFPMQSHQIFDWIKLVANLTLMLLSMAQVFHGGRMAWLRRHLRLYNHLVWLDKSGACVPWGLSLWWGNSGLGLWQRVRLVSVHYLGQNGRFSGK